MTAEEFVVSADEDGMRLDRFLATRISEVSRSRLQRWLEEGRVEIPERGAIRAGLALRTGWRVRVDRPAAVPSVLEPAPIPIHVVHEDEEILVLHKPAGLTVHPGAGCREGTLVQGLLHLHPERTWPGSPERPGIVHRLDRGTSGLMVVACSEHAYRDLRGQIARREAHRQYLAVVWGVPREAEGLIDAPIGRDPRERTRMAVVPRSGLPARTHYRLLWALEFLSLLEVRLETGRTHQIRVHMAHAGFPVFGDATYGGGRSFLSRLAPAERVPMSLRLRRLNRQALHAYHLCIRHPRDGRPWVFEAPLPGDLEVLLREMMSGPEGEP